MISMRAQHCDDLPSASAVRLSYCRQTGRPIDWHFKFTTEKLHLKGSIKELHLLANVAPLGRSAHQWPARAADFSVANVITLR